MAAIDSYEAEQRRQFEAHLARKAEENQHILAELERIKASYAERLRRNLEDVARQKATFGNWLTTKQQEVQNIAEALDLFTNKPEVTATANSAPS
jgi:predicted nuclease with TOPRIM domain